MIKTIGHGDVTKASNGERGTEVWDREVSGKGGVKINNT